MTTEKPQTGRDGPPVDRLVPPHATPDPDAPDLTPAGPTPSDPTPGDPTPGDPTPGGSGPAATTPATSTPAAPTPGGAEPTPTPTATAVDLTPVDSTPVDSTPAEPGGAQPGGTGVTQVSAVSEAPSRPVMPQPSAASAEAPTRRGWTGRLLAKLPRRTDRRVAGTPEHGMVVLAADPTTANRMAGADSAATRLHPATVTSPPTADHPPSSTHPPAPAPAPAPDKTSSPSDRPPGVPPDPWTAFATAPERRPGRLRRAVRALGRAVIHEYAMVGYAALLLAVVMTWPTLRYPLHTVPQDLWDPSVQAWQLAWTGHSLLTDPAALWQGNAFFPERFGLVYSDDLLGYAPLGMIGSGVTAAVLRYNLVFVAAHALLFVGAYALIRQLGAGRTGAAVAGMAFAYAPWRLAQEGHLHIVSAGGVPLALAMLARGHGWSLRYGFRPQHRHVGWAVAGWCVAIWQFSLGLAVGLPFAYALAALVLVSGVAVAVRRLRRRSAGPVLGRKLIVADGVGVLAFAGLGLLVTVPYLRVALLYPDARRAAQEIDFFSPPLRSLFVAPAESRIWGAAHTVPRDALPWAPEMTLLPGFTLYALALAGLLFSLWTLRQRLLLLLGVLGSAVLALGTSVLDGRWTYLPLFGHVPTWTGLRTPGLLILWTTLLLGVLAAGAVGELVRRVELMAAQRVPPWPGPGLRGATLVPLVLVMIEGVNATPHPVVPDQPAAIRSVDGPLLVLPSARLGDQLVMLWSTSRFQEIANGTAGFVPRRQEELRRATATFPDAASIQYLRGLGIKRVVLVRDRVVGTPWERAGDVPVDALGIQREDVADAVVFQLSR